MIKKIMVTLMSLIMIAGTLFSCTSGDKGGDDPKDNSEEAHVLTSEYTVIRGELADESAKAAAISVHRKLNDALSLDMKIKTDFVMPGDTASEKEILVGPTGRETQFDRSTLKEGQIYIGVEGERVIIDAYDSFTLMISVEKLIDQWLSMDECRNGDGGLIVSAETVAKIRVDAVAGTDIRVMSQNLRYTDDPNGNSIDERYPRFASLVAQYKPDLIGTQETTSRWNFILEKTFSGEFEIFKGYSRDGQNADTGEYGTILYRKDRFEFIKGDTFWLSDKPEIKSKFEDSSHYRICTYVILKDKLSGVEFMFCNVHLSGGTSAEKQIKVMTTYLKDEMEKYPTFLTGDFNANPSSATYAHLKTVMEDTYVTANDNKAPIDYTAHDYGALTNKHRIDMCWYKGKNVACREYYTITDSYGGYVSDHYAVMGVCTFI